MFQQINFYNSSDFDIYYQQLQYVFQQYSQSILIVYLIKDSSFIHYCIKNNQRSTPKIFEKFYHLIEFVEHQFESNEQMRVNLLEIITQWCFTLDGHVKSLKGQFNENQTKIIEEYQQGIIASSFQEKTKQFQLQLQQNQQFSDQQFSEIQCFLNQYPQIIVYAQNQIYIILDHAIHSCIYFITQSDIQYLTKTYALNFLSAIINVKSEYCQYILLTLFSINSEIQYKISERLFVIGFANATNPLSISKNAAEYLGALLSSCKLAQERSCYVVMNYLSNMIQQSFNYINLQNLQYGDKKVIIELKTYIYCLAGLYYKIPDYNIFLQKFYSWLFDPYYQQIFKYCINEFDYFLQTIPIEFIEDRDNQLYAIFNQLNQQRIDLEDTQCNFDMFLKLDRLFYLDYSYYQLE